LKIIGLQKTKPFDNNSSNLLKNGIFNVEENFAEYSQNENLGMLSSRRQVEILNDWLDNITKHILAEKSISQLDKNEKLITIYKFVILEIIRQVSVQCSERGALLQKAVEQFSTFMKLYLFFACYDFIRKNTTLEEKMSEIQLSLTQKITELEKNLSLSKNTISQYQIDIEQYKNDIKDKEETISFLTENKSKMPIKILEISPSLEKDVKNSSTLPVPQNLVPQPTPNISQISIFPQNTPQSTPPNASQPNSEFLPKITREELVRRKRARKEQRHLEYERKRKEVVPLNKLRAKCGTLAQHVFLFSVFQKSFVPVIGSDNFSISIGVSSAEIKEGKCTANVAEVILSKEILETGKQMMQRSKSTVKMTDELDEFFVKASSGEIKKREIIKRSYTVMKKGQPSEKIIAEYPPKETIIANIPKNQNLTPIKLSIPEIRINENPLIVIKQEDYQDKKYANFTNDLQKLLEEKDREIEALKSDNKSLLQKLQTRRASFNKNSPMKHRNSLDDNMDNEFLDVNSDKNLDASTFCDDGEIEVKPKLQTDRSKLLLDKITSRIESLKTISIKYSPKMLHKFIYKVYQDVISNYKENLKSFDSPFHLKSSLVFY